MVDEAMALLAEHMARGSRTLAFVGAGASVRAGYPTWRELVEELRTRAFGSETDLPDDLELRAAAELYAERLADRGDLQIEVRRALLAGDIRPAGEFHRKLARLPFTDFITTNYDRLIEDAVDAETRDLMAGEAGRRRDFHLNPKYRCEPLNGRKTNDFNHFLAGLALDEPTRSVLHLHGVLGGEMTLTLGQYDDQYLSDAMELRMFSIFATTTVVFVGASLYDPDVMELVRRSNYHGAKKPRHFAFLPNGRRLEEPMLRKTYGIRPIFYDESVPGHKDLDYQLDQLYELWLRATHVPAGVDPCTQRMRTFRDQIIETDARNGGTERRVDLTDLVEAIERDIRRTSRGAVTFDGLNGPTASATMRHVARRYRELPKGATFDRVVWLSPRRLGLFPPDGGATTRSVAEVLFGGIIAELGAHRLTATLDGDKNLQALRAALDEGDRSRRRRALLVIEDAATLLAWHAQQTDEDDAPDPIAEIIERLPDGSRAVYRSVLDDEDGDSSRPDGHHRAFVVDDQLSEPHHDLIDRKLESMTPAAAQILAALAISAHPLDEAELAAMLDGLGAPTNRDLGDAEGGNGTKVAALSEIVDSCGDLADQGLAIRDPRRSGDQLGASRCAYTVTAQMRNAVLAAKNARSALEAAAESLLRWAEKILSTARKWEVDHTQFDRLMARLPVLISVFDGGCWLGLHEPGGADPVRAERLLWLGRDLSRLLYTAGRWPEALEIAMFLTSQTEGVDDGGTLDREAHLLIASILAHASTGGPEAAKIAALHVISSAEDLESMDTRRAQGYPPARITPQRQVAKARLRLAQLGSGHTDRAEADDGAPDAEERIDPHTELESLLGEFRGKIEASDRAEDEDMQILGDVAGYLAEQKLNRLPEDLEAAGAPISDLMRVLDEGHRALAALGNRRRLGHHARLRGDVLLRVGNNLAARRSYVEALLVSNEFRDRYLEAQAKLGLAECDENWQLADDARRLFDELKVVAEEERAEETCAGLDPSGDALPARTPDVVVFIGAPGSGKRLARDVAMEMLDRWDYDEHFMRIDPGTEDRLRNRDAVAPAEIRAEIVSQLEKADPATRTVLLTKLSLWDPDYIGPFDEERELLRRMLVVSLAAPRNVLRRRNEQRLSGELPADVFDAVDEETGHGPPPDGYLSWRSWFEERGAAYVEITTGYRAGAADVPVQRQRRHITEELELSFVTPACILRNRGLSAVEPCTTATG